MLNPLNLISKFIKSGTQKELNRINKIVLQINSFEDDISKLSDEEFPKKTLELIKKLKDGESFNNIGLISCSCGQLKVYISRNCCAFGLFTNLAFVFSCIDVINQV